MDAYSFDTATETFEIDVLKASEKVPVLVDFWAPWCAPCRVLKPVLEKLAVEYQGRFLLAKVNSDEHPKLSAQFGVRGIPNVKAFVDGKLADEFTGALPESGVRAFIDRLIPTPGEKLRRASREDVRVLYESGADLRAEELEEDPRQADPAGYARRTEDESRDGYTHLWTDPQGLRFRASVSAVTPDAAQVSAPHVAEAIQYRRLHST